jgi:hypothetical protein
VLTTIKSAEQNQSFEDDINLSISTNLFLVDKMQPNIAIEEVPNKFRLEAWSLKGQLVNNGRCPK